MGQGQDPVVRAFRERISETDRDILDAVNRRLELVRDLHAYKAGQGYQPIDRAREQRLLRALAAANAGPLSDEGVRELVGSMLELTKRELTRQAAALDGVQPPSGERPSYPRLSRNPRG